MRRFIPFIAVALLFSGCEDKQTQQAGASMEMPPLPVKASKVSFSDEPYSKTYSAILKPFNEVDVMARVKGYLVHKNFQEGSFVKKGELLYEIQKDEYQAALSVAKANVANDESAKEKATRDWDRAKTLYEKKAISTEQRDALLYAYDSAKAKLAQSKATLQNAQLDFSYTSIKAPISGIVGMKTNDVGSYISSDTKLTTITAVDPLYVEFSLPSDDIHKYLEDVKLGSSIKVLYGKKEFEAVVDYIAPKVESSTDTLQLRAKLDNPDNALVIGSFAEVKLDGLTLEHVAAIPQTAIIKTAEGVLVWVADGGVATMKKVTLLNAKDSIAYIGEGLEEGDMVITSNIAKIRPNAKVNIVEGN